MIMIMMVESQQEALLVILALYHVVLIDTVP